MKKAIDTDPGLHRFRKTNLFYVKDPYYLYQDPTVLGFKLMFDFWGDGLLSTNPNNPNTALNYLIRTGQSDRAILLKKFIYHLIDINNKTPWFFQEITGLDEAWKRGFNASDGFSPLLSEDRKITISCLESIDLRITALIDLYRKSCFDWIYRREVVPWNLRQFNVLVYVYELRNINKDGLPSATDFIDMRANLIQQDQNLILLGEGLSDKKSLSMGSIVQDTLGNLKTLAKDTVTGLQDKLGNNNRDNLGESSNTIDTKISRLMFDFKQCEFLPDESAEFLSKISNAGSDVIGQSFSFSYRNIEESNLNNIYAGDSKLNDYLIKILDVAALDGIKNGPKGTVSDNQSGGFVKNIINSVAQLGASTVEKFVKNQVGRALLGNVYGFQPEQILGSIGGALSGNPAEALTGVKDAIRQGSNAYTNIKNKLDNRDGKPLGNIYNK